MLVDQRQERELLRIDTLVRNAVSRRVRAMTQPTPANLVIDNDVQLYKGACRRGSGGVVVAMPDGATGSRIKLAGRYADGCGPLSLTRAVMRAPDFAFGTFKTLWRESGGTLDGGMKQGVVPPDAQLLYSFEFPARQGSLREFLEKVSGHWNISLFHYRNHGAAFLRAVCGFEVPKPERPLLEAVLASTGLDYHPLTQSRATCFLLKPEDREA